MVPPDDLMTYDTKAKQSSTAFTVTGTDVAGNKRALDVQVAGGTVTGTFRPTGLNTAGRVTTMDVGPVATAIPAVPLAGRNAISIHNLDGTEIVYLGFSVGVTANAVVGTTSGWEIDANGNVQFDITDNIILYAITSGATVRIKILEVA